MSSGLTTGVRGSGQAMQGQSEASAQAKEKRKHSMGQATVRQGLGVAIMPYASAPMGESITVGIKGLTEQ